MRAGVSWQSSVAAAASPEHVKRITSPGSRLLLLNQPETGNHINMATIKDLNKLLITSDKSESVSVVFFGSDNEHIFSQGVAPQDFVGAAQTGHLPKYLQANANFIRDYRKPTVAVYTGEASGSAFGLFAGSEFRLGSPSFSLVVDELARGQVPMGGLAYHMTRGCAEGAAAARYAALSQRRLYSHELAQLGLLTHLVGENSFDTLSCALSLTVSDTRTELTKARYVAPIDASYLRELIDDMDVRDPDPAAGAFPEDGADWDVYRHPVWQQASLVPEQTLDSLESALGPVTGAHADADTDAPELAAVMREVDRCFNSVHNATPAQSVECLRELDSAWARGVLAAMEKVDAEVMQIWFALTDGATRWSYQETLSAEYHANMNLMHRQLYKTPIDMATVFTKLPAACADIKPLKF